MEIVFKRFLRFLWYFFIMTIISSILLILLRDYISYENLSKIYNFQYEHSYIHPIGNRQIPIGFLLIFYAISFFLTYYLQPTALLRFLDIIVGCNCTRRFKDKIQQMKKSNSRIYNFFKKMSCIRIYTLRNLLEDKGCTRKDMEAMRNKAKESKAFPTMLAAFSTVFIAIIVQDKELCQSLLFRAVVLFQIISIVLIVIGFDSLDSSLNKYRLQPTEFVKKYYRRGIRLSYFGMQLILISFLMVTLAIHWKITLFGTITLFVFGFSYWFPSQD